MTVLPAEAFRPWAELAAPPGLSNLPRPGLFVGRAGELARLDAALAGPGGVVVQAVHGLGGVGKSTLAARWAAAHAADYTLTWWITAATPADIDAGLAALAVALQPALTGCAAAGGAAGRGGAVAGRPLRVAADPGQRDRPGRHRAAAGPGPRRPVPDHQPPRVRLARHRAVPVRLDVLDPAEAQALLAAILTPDRPREADGAAELCAELGFLPLAIEQAGAYLAQVGATPREYLDLLARYPAAMYQAAAEGGDAARTIARIWRVTLDRLADDPLAGQVLRILAWYAPDGIPRTLLDGLADPPAVLRAVGRLAAYSMLTVDAGTLAMHRLVQAVTRTPDPGDPHRDPEAIDAARDQATRQLADALPDWQDPAGWPGWRMLLPHIDALASHAPPDTDTRDTAYLLNQAGLFLDGQGQPGRAAGYLQRALADCVRVLGADHPDTLALAEQPRLRLPGRGGPGPGHPAVRAGPGRPAAGAGRRPPRDPGLAEQPRRRLPGGGGPGPGHPAVRAGPRRLRAGAGRRPPRHPGLAEQPRRRLRGRGGPGPGHPAATSRPWPTGVRVLGADHPDTLGSRNNLASAYRGRGGPGPGHPAVRAGPRRPAAGAGRRPPRHPGLAEQPRRAYQDAGDLGRAIPLYEQALADRQRVLGADHPDTLGSRNNLAAAYRAAGDLGRAIPLFEQALADCVRVLGADHPLTKIVRGNLAAARQHPQ